MGLGAYFREKKAAWVAEGELRYNRAIKFVSISQENFSLVTSSFLFIGFALGISVLFLEPLMSWNPVAFIGSMMVVLVAVLGLASLVLKRSMKKAGV